MPKILSFLPQAIYDFTTSTELSKVTIPTIPFVPIEVSGANYLSISGVPTGTTGNVDFVNSTSSGFGSLTVDKQISTAASGGYYVMLTGVRVPGTTANFIAQSCILTINSVEIARLWITSTKIGYFNFFFPFPDPRFALTGAGSTGDLIFTFSVGADPSLQIRAIFLLD